MQTISNISEDKYCIYQGEVSNEHNEPEGYGILQTNKYIYNGYFKNGKYNGPGKITYNIISKTYKTDINVTNISPINDPNKNKFKKHKKNNIIDDLNKNVKEDIKDVIKDVIKEDNKEDNKEILYEGSFKNGLRDGNGKIIYLNGNIFIGLFKDDLKHGLGNEYSKDGKLLSKCDWTNGVTNEKTLYIDYNEKGSKKIEGYMQNNKKIDLWKYYDNNGEMIKLIYYEENNSYTIDIFKTVLGHLNYDTFLNGGEILSIKINSSFIDKLIDIYSQIMTKIKNNNFDEQFIELIKNYGINDKVKYIINIKKYNDKYEFDNIKEINISNNDYIIKKIDHTIIYRYSLFDKNRLDEKYSLLDEKIIAKGVFNKFNNLLEGSLYLNDQIYKEGIFNIDETLINGKIYDNGIIIYEGKLQNNQYNDVNGKLYENGLLIYEGGFVDNMKHGYGTLYHTDLMTLSYIGNWSNDMRHGQGSIFDELGELVINGYFENNNLL
jgi:hypothetical protein